MHRLLDEINGKLAKAEAQLTDAQQTIARLEVTLRTIAEEDYDLFDSPVRLAREALISHQRSNP